ncbi:MAG: hypothetical protein IKK72_05195 [Oscillospiraceae bacterium]|nr:hypothetical protein [Oscillospiraceae bacterium]
MNKKQNWTYCVVGNIKKTHYEKDETLRYGTAAFTGGTKVYISGRIWDRTRDHINALGITRGRRFEVIWTDVTLIENLRCRKVLNPAIIGFMDHREYCAGWWGKSKREKADAEAFVKWWNENLISPQEDTV